MSFDPYSVSLPELRAALVDNANQRIGQRQQSEAWAESMRPAFDQFLRDHPDFAPTENNLRQLAATLVFDASNPRAVFEGRKVTAESFHGAHAYNVYSQVYEAAPAPTPETMPLETLRAEVMNEPAPDAEYTKPLAQLREELYSQQQPTQPSTETSMSLDAERNVP